MTDVYPKYKVVKVSQFEYDLRTQDKEGEYWYWDNRYLTKWGAILVAKWRIAKDERERNKPSSVVVWGPEP